jgi:hypothetical protein
MCYQIGTGIDVQDVILIVVAGKGVCAGTGLT